MTNRSCLEAATASAPLGSAVFSKSRFARYLDSFRLATAPSPESPRCYIEARVAPAGQALRLLLDQTFGRHCFDDMRARADALHISLEIGAELDVRGTRPSQDRKEIRIGNGEVITHQVFLVAQGGFDILDAFAHVVARKGLGLIADLRMKQG